MANKNFTTMKDNVADEINDTSTTMKAIIGEYLNKRYFQILRAVNWNRIRTDYTFNTVAGTQAYAMPDDFGKPIYVLDDTNDKNLAETTLDDLVRNYPSTINSNGTLARYALIDDVVRTQPSTAAVVGIVSSSASDTAPSVLIRGMDANGIESTEEETLTGETKVETTTKFERIIGISKSAVTVGYITVTSGTDTLTILPPKLLESRVKLLFLHEVPASTIAIDVSYVIKPFPLIEDEDYPVIDVADLMETGAKADAWRYKKQGAMAKDFELLFSKELEDYIWDMHNKPNFVPRFRPVTFNRDDLV